MAENKPPCVSVYPHIHGTIWKERGLLSTQGKGSKHAEGILKPLEAVQKPLKAAIMHCKYHQNGDTDQEKRNRMAAQTAKKVEKEGRGIKKEKRSTCLDTRQ